MIRCEKDGHGLVKIWEMKKKITVDPFVKLAHFGNVMSIDMTLPKWAIFKMVVYGEILCFLSDPAEISFLTTWKRCHTSWKFQLEIRSNKSYHRKLFDNLYEMNSRYFFYFDRNTFTFPFSGNVSNNLNGRIQMNAQNKMPNGIMDGFFLSNSDLEGWSWP